MRYIAIVMLLGSFLLASANQRLALIPANVNYSQENVEMFSELLYETLSNAVAEYNFKQKQKSRIYLLEEILLPEKSARSSIRSVHNELKHNSVSYLNRYGLSKVIVMDFNSRRANHIVRRCNKICNITISLTTYSSYGAPKTQKIVAKYNGDLFVFTDRSIREINRFVANFLTR